MFGPATVFDVQRHLARGVADRQVSDDAIALPFEPFDTRAPEPELGVLLDVEEVRRAEVGVALGRTRVDAGGVDRRLDRRSGEVTVVEVRLAGVDREAASHLRDHHVTDREVDTRLGGVDVPGVRAHGMSSLLTM